MTGHENILEGKVIITTYPPKDDDILYQKLTDAGAIVLNMPVIEVLAIPYKTNRPIEEYDWLVFTSKNAVEPITERFPNITAKIAALGLKTAEELSKYKLTPTFTGSGKSGADFAIELSELINKDEKVLLVLGNLAPDTLQDKLNSKADVERIDVYQTKTLEQVDARILHLMKLEHYDAVIVTSPSTAKGVVKHLGNHKNIRFISIGKTTTEAIRELSMEPLATSNDQSYEGLAETTIQYFLSK